MAEERRQTHDQPAAKVIRELTKLARNLGELSVARRDAVAIALGLGWWMRCIRSAGAVRLLYKSGLSHEASPTLRALLLHAAAIEWLRQYPDDVVEAVRYEHEDYRQKLYQKASDRQWDLSRITLGPPPAGQRPEGLSFLREAEKLCARIGAEHLYVAYRIESPYSHPSALSADVYWRFALQRGVTVASRSQFGLPA